MRPEVQPALGILYRVSICLSMVASGPSFHGAATYLRPSSNEQAIVNAATADCHPAARGEYIQSSDGTKDYAGTTPNTSLAIMGRQSRSGYVTHPDSGEDTPKTMSVCKS